MLFKQKVIISLLCLFSLSSLAFAMPIPVLELSFNGNLDAVTANGDVIKPSHPADPPNTYVIGIDNRAIEFKEAKEYVRYSKINLPAEDFSLTFWYKDTGAGTYSATTTRKVITLWTASANYLQMEFRYTATKQPYFWQTTFVKGNSTPRVIYFRDEQVEYKVPNYVPNVWHCIGLTFNYSESLATFYLDGIPVSTLKIDGFNLEPSANSYLSVGAEGGSLKGIFDEIAIYDKVLTDDEMLSYYEIYASDKQRIYDFKSQLKLPF